jgi:hypothetical protein
MSPALNLNIPDKKQSEAKNISIEIESSPPFILAVAQLFRAHKQPNQSVELCRQGLNNFPGDMGLRLEMALGYWDLKENEKAWAEITAIAQELNTLAPSLKTVAYLSRELEQSGLSEWFALLSQVLTKYPGANLPDKEVDAQLLEKKPGKGLEAEAVPPGVNMEQSLPSPMECQGKDPAGEALHDSKVLATLTDWVSQLKEELP